jgi:2-beta-glucuronyltransferase
MGISPGRDRLTYPPAMPTAVLVTGHIWASNRRGGFHWLADALRDDGWHVVFVTANFSALSHLKDDHRHRAGAHRSAGRPIEVEPGVTTYVWYPPFHPLNRLPGILDLLATPLFRTYGRLPAPGLRPLVEAADLIVFESTSGLGLAAQFRRWNPRARVVYRVSDDLRLLRASRATFEAERALLSYADLVSVPSPALGVRFEGHPRLEVHRHGIHTAPFDAPSADPYPRHGIHAVFVGTAYLDRRFLEIAADAFPDWTFHIIGPLSQLPARPNLVAHGELPFVATVPYIVHADIGLATWFPGDETQADSLKIIQYSYAGLPIVAPDFLRSPRPNVFAYRPGDAASIRAALLAARAFTDRDAARAGVTTWADLARSIVGPAR